MRQANQGTPRQEQNPTKAIVRYVNESDACDDHTPAPVRVALIPAYEPGEHMVPVARALHGAGMEVVVVNDGSSAACDAAFQQVASGVAVHDTQTGLRAFSGALTPRLLAIDGSRYEYETSVLLEFARDGVPLREVSIRTIYLDKNAASHFDPLRDSVRIYGRILRFSASSLVSFGIDYLLFCLLLSMIGAATICNVCARVVSGAINFALNRKVVFGGGGPVAKSFARYVALAVSLLVCNTVLLSGLVGWGVSAYVAKIAVELALFLVSFCVQQRFVFAEKGEDHGKKLKKDGRPQAVVAGVSDGARGPAGTGRQALASAQKAFVGNRF